MKIQDLAALVNGRVIGNADLEISGVCGIEEAGATDLSFIANPRYESFQKSTGAGGLIVSEELIRTRDDLTYIVVSDPYQAFVQILPKFRAASPSRPSTIHPSASIDLSATIGKDVFIGPNVIIEDRAVIGDGVTLLGNAFIGARVVIGSDSYIGPNVSLLERTVLGRRCCIHAGSVIGGDGFGYLQNESGHWEKVPQLGYVEIGDDVEIGSCVTIDRATIGRTRLGNGCKLDNHVHVAHNVVIGSNTVIAAQTGISGSTHLGSNNQIAGQVGFVGHIETVDNVIVEAQSGVSKSLMKPGRYFGHPAKEHGVALRQEGAMRQLPDLLREIQELRRQIEELREGAETE